MILYSSHLCLTITGHLGEKEILELKPNLSLACCVTIGKLQLTFPRDAQAKSHVMIVPCRGDASGRVC